MEKNIETVFRGEEYELTNNDLAQIFDIRMLKSLELELMVGVILQAKTKKWCRVKDGFDEI